MRERLVYIGPNSENISGSSAKFWSLDPVGGSRMIRATWGKIGTTGQSKMYMPEEASVKLAEKLRKGYVRADTAPVPTTPAGPRRSLEDRIASSTFRPFSFDELIRRMASRKMVELADLPLGREMVKLFLDEEQAIWGVIRDGDAFVVAFIGPRSS